jgi:hypothetical protein
MSPSFPSLSKPWNRPRPKGQTSHLFLKRQSCHFVSPRTPLFPVPERAVPENLDIVKSIPRNETGRLLRTRSRGKGCNYSHFMASINCKTALGSNTICI